MSENSKSIENQENEETFEEENKKEYTSPTIESEDLTVYGAACNGTNRGGRKAATTDVPPCNPSRLTS